MDHTSGQSSDMKMSSVDFLPQPLVSVSKHSDMLLLVVITAVTVLAIKTVQSTASLSANWFITPGILAAMAVIPSIIRRKKLFNIGLSFGQIKSSFAILAGACLLVLPAMFCGLCLLKHYSLNFPLWPVLPENQQLASWLFYQFMYVAVAEELFFRGFLQSSILNLLITAVPKRRFLQCFFSVVLSAVCFAIAHMIIHESAFSVLIIAPGLILGWLYLKTDSLIAPILFHGIANASYYFLTGFLAG